MVRVWQGFVVYIINNKHHVYGLRPCVLCFEKACDLNRHQQSDGNVLIYPYSPDNHCVLCVLNVLFCCCSLHYIRTNSPSVCNDTHQGCLHRY